MAQPGGRRGSVTANQAASAAAGGGGGGGEGGKGSGLNPENDPNALVDNYLRSHNPNIGSTPVYFDYKKEFRTFRLFSQVDHTATHLAIDGNLIPSNTEEANKMREEADRRQKEMELADEAERNPDLVEQGVSTRILKNQFNYCDRASQTINLPKRERVVVTDPPPSIPYPNTVSQQIIFDAYEEERIANERAAAGKHAAAAAAARGGSRKKDAQDKAAENDKAGGGAGGSGQDIQSSPAYLHALKILERMVNQNDSWEIIDDFRYWDDKSDDYKEDGNLLPLWRFMSDKVKRKEVTCIAWNPKYTDLFAVGYGSYEFLRQGTGAVLCFTLKNAFPAPTSSGASASPAHPEFAMHLDSGVMAIDFHPNQPALLACGLYDGSVCVFDLRQRASDGTLKPQFHSTVRTGKHTDPVWDVRWSRDTSGTLQFFSISSDGRVTAWHLSKSELQFSDIMQLTVSGADSASSSSSSSDNNNKQGGGGQSNALVATAAASGGGEGGALVDPEAALLNVSGGTCFDFSWESENIFVIGTEDGYVRRCSKAYNAQYLDAYEGHHMAVYTVKWNYFHAGVFLSCSADWTVKLWEKSSSRPLLTFDLANSVGDVAWAPYSSTVFAAVTSDGKVHVFDLAYQKNEALCTQQVVKGAKLNRIAFNPKDPIILVGDTRGSILSLKLSPNLRRKGYKWDNKTMQDDPASLRKYEVEKLNKLIEITLKDRELLDR